MKKKRRLKKKVIYALIEIILIIIIFLSSYKIYTWLNSRNKSIKILEDLSNSIKIVENDQKELTLEEQYHIDFDSLKNINSDTIGWIKVNYTDIEYPIVKTNNNSYYLRHSFDKSYNIFGWIFANYENNFDGTDKNLTLFGHAMYDGSMFGTLKKVFTNDWINNSNHEIILVSENRVEKYIIFSAYKYDAETFYFKNDFIDEYDYASFLKIIKNRSSYDFNVDINTDDKILTLSTCDEDNIHRVVVHAKLIK